MTKIRKIKFLEKFCEKNYLMGRNPLPIIRKTIKGLKEIQFLYDGIGASCNNYAPEHGSFCVLNEKTGEVYFLLPCMKEYNENGILVFVEEYFL